MVYIGDLVVLLRVSPDFCKHVALLNHVLYQFSFAFDTLSVTSVYLITLSLGLYI